MIDSVGNYVVMFSATSISDTLRDNWYGSWTIFERQADGDLRRVESDRDDTGFDHMEPAWNVARARGIERVRVLSNDRTLQPEPYHG